MHQGLSLSFACCILWILFKIAAWGSVKKQNILLEFFCQFKCRFPAAAATTLNKTTIQLFAAKTELIVFFGGSKKHYPAISVCDGCYGSSIVCLPVLSINIVQYVCLITEESHWFKSTISANVIWISFNQRTNKRAWAMQSLDLIKDLRW